jgi:hypothetical protein
MILILSSRYVTTADQCLSPIRPTTSHLGSPVVRAAFKPPETAAANADHAMPADVALRPGAWQAEPRSGAEPYSALFS